MTAPRQPPPASTGRAPRAGELSGPATVADRRIAELQTRVLSENTTFRAAGLEGLARLRRAAGEPAGSVADVLVLTLDEAYAPDDGTLGDIPTRVEVAVHIAMTTYAIHQQGRTRPMHRRGHGLGSSIRRLMPREIKPPLPPTLRRFQALGTSSDLDELSHYLRGIAQQLRSAYIPLDYALLVDDLTKWPDPAEASRVRLRWGREFYFPRKAPTAVLTTEPARDDIDVDGQ